MVRCDDDERAIVEPDRPPSDAIERRPDKSVDISDLQQVIWSTWSDEQAATCDGRPLVPRGASSGPPVLHRVVLAARRRN